MKNIFRYQAGVVFIIVLSVMLINCKKEKITSTQSSVNTSEASEVNKFVYNGMKDYYLWTGQVPNLSAAKFSNKDTLNGFLNTYTDPNKLFNDLLYQYKTVDKWSFIVDNGKTIDDWIQGISETMGYDFMLARFGTGDNVFGFVRYVYKGSPAEKAGMKRGDLFMKVDDQQLTVSNYSTLLFNKLTYKLTFASIALNIISLNGKTATMTAVNMQENPIQLDTVFTVNNLKVGYLVYNGFTSDFDIQLNNVFKKFKDAAISRLVVDLRYNGGGSVQSAKYLASMIYGTVTSKVFLKSQYNAGLQAYYTTTYGANWFNENFVDKITKTATVTTDTPINTVNMTKVYVITSDNTASASELLINGLKPYLTIFNVGINTAGKYVGSYTLKDYIDNNGTVNPNNKWAMQPIVVKIANANGVTDYVGGLMPDYVATEDIANLMPFGDPNETLLKVVLNDIKGLPLSSVTQKSQQMGLQKVFDSQELRPFSKQMFVNNPHLINPGK